MYRAFCKVLATVAVICCLCMNAGATGPESTSVSYDGNSQEMVTILRASGSFNISVNPYWRLSKGCV